MTRADKGEGEGEGEGARACGPKCGARTLPRTHAHAPSHCDNAAPPLLAPPPPQMINRAHLLRQLQKPARPLRRRAPPPRNTSDTGLMHGVMHRTATESNLSICNTNGSSFGNVAQVGAGLGGWGWGCKDGWNGGTGCTEDCRREGGGRRQVQVAREGAMSGAGTWARSGSRVQVSSHHHHNHNPHIQVNQVYPPAPYLPPTPPPGRPARARLHGRRLAAGRHHARDRSHEEGEAGPRGERGGEGKRGVTPGGWGRRGGRRGTDTGGRDTGADASDLRP